MESGYKAVRCVCWARDTMKAVLMIEVWLILSYCVATLQMKSKRFQSDEGQESRRKDSSICVSRVPNARSVHRYKFLNDDTY